MDDEQRTMDAGGSDPGSLPPPLPPPPSAMAPSPLADPRPKAGRMRRVAAFVAIGLILAVGGYGIRTVTSPGGAAASSSGASSAVSVNLSSGDGVATLARTAEQAIVRVTSRIEVQGSFFQPAQEATLEGTGFVVVSDGLILTNAHVIEGADQITVTLADGSTYDATVVRSDDAGDLAVLRIDATDLPTLQLESASPVVGESVVAIGYALGLEGDPTVTTGIVSSTDRTIQVQDEVAGTVRSYAHILQISAPINSGNSGGPVLDTQGRVIAIATAGAQGAQDVGFAIPIAQAGSLVAAAA